MAKLKMSVELDAETEAKIHEEQEKILEEFNKKEEQEDLQQEESC